MIQDELKDFLRKLKYAFNCIPPRLPFIFNGGKIIDSPVQFIAENKEWAIKYVAQNIQHEINAVMPNTVGVTTKPYLCRNKIVHFGSQYMWLACNQFMADNKYVVSYFHGKYEDGPDVARHIDNFISSIPKLRYVITPASHIEKRLLSWGIPQNKLVKIPIGVDAKVFYRPSFIERSLARKKLNIPDDAIVIGSFQKDGVGWGEGDQPKLIKGPDIFVDAVDLISRHKKIIVLLTGPARGYIKNRLNELNIPFIHLYAESQSDLVFCYHALDLYLVSSREEGGPMGLIEAMASGVPVISTSVGMAPDLIEDGSSGGLMGDLDFSGVSLGYKAMEVISAGNIEEIKTNARKKAELVDWAIVSREHWVRVYQPLLQE